MDNVIWGGAVLDEAKLAVNSGALELTDSTSI